MTPEQFRSRLAKSGAPPAVLFLGPEAWERRRCQKELLKVALPDPEAEGAITRYDLTETKLPEILDDARSLSLFTSARVILAGNAEAALPRGRAAADDDGEGAGADGNEQLLAEYLKDPTPEVTIVFESTRLDFDGDDKKKLDRVRQFFGAVTEAVEFKPFSVEDASRTAWDVARGLKLDAEREAIEMVAESLGGDMGRIAVELEKLQLYAIGRKLLAADVLGLVPDARQANIFALVNSLAKRERARSLELLDSLSREGEYLPLVLSFLAAQFRHALTAREAGLKSSQQIQGYFSKLGIPMWGSRAEQVQQTASKFSTAQLGEALRTTFTADRELRDARPDDRVVMEKLIFALTARKERSN